MAVRYAALSACRKVHPWRKDVTDGNDNGTDGLRTDRQTDRQSATQYAAPS